MLESGELELNEGDESDPPPQAVNIKAEKTHKESILIFHFINALLNYLFRMILDRIEICPSALYINMNTISKGSTKVCQLKPAYAEFGQVQNKVQI